MKKLLLSLFTVLLSCSAWAQYVEINGISYYLDGSTMEASVARYPYYTGNVIIPSSVTYSDVTYSVTRIYDGAFLKCTGLNSIVIPKSVTSITGNAFSGCSGLTSIIVSNENPIYDSRDNCNAIIETASNTLITGCQTTVIPNSITSISGAFTGCTGLTAIKIPNSVTSIAKSAFEGCSGLTSIIVSNENPIYDSRDNCNAIIETASNTLITGCQNTVIPNSITSIGSYAFSGCSVLTSITIPNSVTNIGSGAFQYCSGLTSVEIPNSVTSIGSYAFSGCSGLTSITIPNSVTNIGSGAFYECSGLTSITCEATTPPTLGHYAFDYIDQSACTLYVPSESVADYKRATQWKNFNNILPIDPTGIGDVNIVEEESPKSYFDMNGRKNPIPQKGVNIVKYADGKVGKIVIK